MKSAADKISSAPTNTKKIGPTSDRANEWTDDSTPLRTTKVPKIARA